MTTCKRCLQSFDAENMIGVNVFIASTGQHINTKRYCLFCAKTMGLITA